MIEKTLVEITDPYISRPLDQKLTTEGLSVLLGRPLSQLNYLCSWLTFDTLLSASDNHVKDSVIDLEHRKLSEYMLNWKTFEQIFVLFLHTLTCSIIETVIKVNIKV